MNTPNKLTVLRMVITPIFLAVFLVFASTAFIWEIDISGNEKVIVSQLARSPGAYFNCIRDEKTGKPVYPNKPTEDTLIKIWAIETVRAAC